MSVTDFWEPWQPKVGDRVRTNFSPECPAQYLWHGNWAEGSGLVGTIMGSIGSACPEGHPYRVHLEAEPYVIWAAACELEPLDPTP